MRKLGLLAIALVMSAPSFAQNNQAVATINGDEITKKEFEEYHLQNLKFVGQRKITKEVSLQDLIHRQLGIQKARTTGLDKDPMVVSKQEDILFHAQISKDLENEFKKISVTDADVEKYYEDHKEYRTAHILYRLRAEPTPEETKAAYAQSMEIHAQVQKEPDSFAKLANKFSQTSGAPLGGDLGFQPPTRLAPEYFEAIKGQKVGHVTKPIRTQMGYHVIKILGVKSIDQVDKNLYKKIIYDIKRDALIENYFKGLSKGADIKTNKNLL
ncbi:MAG TPA: peptidylprolyl isomerase [Bacteriovoracaceae bacterium]|nr:peptidylprolyl isomerase [Bacteriovoracaceae bacterium]